MIIAEIRASNNGQLYNLSTHRTQFVDFRENSSHKTNDLRPKKATIYY